MVRLASVLGVIIVLIGCAEVESPAAEGLAAARQIVSLDTLVDSLQSTPAGGEAAALVEQLGEPDRVEVETIGNRYATDRLDTVRTISYYTSDRSGAEVGVEVVFYEVSGSDKTFPIRLTVTDPAFTLAGVHVGSTRAEVEAALGRPSEQSDDRYSYPTDPIVPDRFEIHLDGGVVSRIDWLPYWE